MLRDGKRLREVSDSRNISFEMLREVMVRGVDESYRGMGTDWRVKCLILGVFLGSDK